jgi:hypothetical protein
MELAFETAKKFQSAIIVGDFNFDNSQEYQVLTDNEMTDEVCRF